MLDLVLLMVEIAYDNAPYGKLFEKENLFVPALADGAAFVDNHPLAKEIGRQVKRNGESLVEFHQFLNGERRNEIRKN